MFLWIYVYVYREMNSAKVLSGDVLQSCQRIRKSGGESGIFKREMRISLRNPEWRFKKKLKDWNRKEKKAENREFLEEGNERKYSQMSKACWEGLGMKKNKNAENIGQSAKQVESK